MKAIMVMYDSLRRDLLESYGCNWTITPNFKRLAEKSVQFDNCYVGSMPCMPARRELHTGRINFFHRSWGPMEPYDDSMPEQLKNGGIYTHLISDHQHYWEDGGCTYHNRYSSWEISRGQEGDLWKADLSYKYEANTVFKNKEVMLTYPPYKNMMMHDGINRRCMDKEDKTSQAVTFKNGLEFIRTNHEEDNWFLQIETFDPHEPFYSLKEDKALYPHTFSGDAASESDWPPYAPVAEDEDTVSHVRFEYAALLSKCDRYLGKVLDLMDRYNLWEDTMLIVNTDHGFLLGEHGWWGKTSMPIYQEIAHIPFYIYDPRRKECAGIRRKAIVQTIDLAPTLLEFFGLKIPEDMEGKPLCSVMDSDESVREYAVFGYHGSQVNVTDGRYIYMHAAENLDEPVFEYTLMPTHMRSMFQPAEFKDMELAGPFSFTKNCKVMKIRKKDNMGDTTSFGSLLFDLKEDPDQIQTISDEAVRNKMKGYIREYMEKNDAPNELYTRLGLKKEKENDKPS
ncbi:sulfatase [Clostridium boliviensis]|uniref:Sulfatase n=1 Tax=Clostridium boliviensis TaxID=318465 RepID=A0ABU4GMP1_9CLOT|nr:sulfatase [Clostridium boliviensis]MDW2798884.1 sulfatase [Clostridium boliviensis]